MNQMIKILGELPKPDKLNQQILQKTFPEYFEPRFKKILSKRQEMKQKAKNEDIIKGSWFVQLKIIEKPIFII